MQTFFITGATGFIGRTLVAQLRREGADVRAVVRNPERASDLGGLGATLFRGDVSDKASLVEPMRGVDGVFHLAGWYKVGVHDERAAVATNVNGTRNVLECIRDLRVPKAVYTSSLAVNSDTRGVVVNEDYEFQGTHLSLYDRTKAEAHQIAREFQREGLPLVIVQPGLVYGPGDTSLAHTTLVQYLQRRLPLVPSGAAYAWGHVEDIANGHALAMKSGRTGTNYLLAGPVHTLLDALEIARDITGIAPPALRAPAGLLKALAPFMGLVEKVFPLPADYTAETLRVIAGVTYIGSGARARRELGWTARPLRDGLVETLGYEMRRLGIVPAKFSA